MTEYVLGFLFSSDLEKIALIRKNKPDWQAGLLNGIGGHIEKNEQPITAMVREFWEETGLLTSEKEWFLAKKETNQENNYILYIYYAVGEEINFLRSTTEEQIDLINTSKLKDKQLVTKTIIYIHSCIEKILFLIEGK